MPTAALVADHPIFRQLSFERSLLGSLLALVMAATYFSYILVIAFDPSALAIPIHSGSVITWGIVVGAGLLSFGFVLTAFYVVLANTRLDSLIQRLREAVE